MDNIITYLKFRGDISFKEHPLNEVDACIFAVLVGIDYSELELNRTPLGEVYEKYLDKAKADSMDERMSDKEEILRLAANSERFKGVLLDNFVKDINEEEEKTFYAITYYMSKYEAFVAFRGTDGSLVSWKENFNGLYEYPTKGQYDALLYLTNVIKKPFVKVSTVGHSKGGNLAVYSAMSLDIKYQKKLKAVYAFDAPGYIENIEDKLSYQNIKDRIKAYVPESCVIGKLMNPPYEHEVMAAFGNGIFQHDMFNWEVCGTAFKKEEATNLYSTEISSRINAWMDSIPYEQRKQVVDELFSVFSKNGIHHISDLMHMDLKHILSLFKCVTLLSSENRELLHIILKQITAH